MLIKANELTLYILTRLMRKNKLWLDIKIAVKLEHTPLLALSTDKGLIPHELDTSEAEANPSFPATPLHLLNALYISLRALALPNHSQQWLLSPLHYPQNFYSFIRAEIPMSSFPQQPNQIHFQHPLSRHMQSFDNYYSRCEREMLPE